MALDPRIPLMVQPVQLPDFNAIAQQRAMAARNAFAMRQMQQEQEDRAAVRNAYAQALGANGQLDTNKLISGLAGANRGELIPQVQEQAAQTQAAQAKASSAQLALHLEEANQALEDIASVQTPEDALSLLNYHEQQTNDPRFKILAESVRRQLSADPSSFPTVKSKLLQMTLSGKEQLAQQLAQAKAEEDARHNRVAESTAARNASTSERNAAIAAGRLGVAQGALSLAKQKANAGGEGVSVDALLSAAGLD